jgi:hypothetical protein
MSKRVWIRLKKWLAGKRLARAVERNQRAADDLDQALRKVLRQ